MTITADDFWCLVGRLGDVGSQDIDWSEAASLPATAEAFASETIFVICNSGMKHTIATKIFERCMGALKMHAPVAEVFGHKGKAAAIEHVWGHRADLFATLLSTPIDAQLAFLKSLPFIGDITVYHLAKNFGMDVAKPDVHLQRLAVMENCSTQELCERLSRQTGLRIATVDTILWRACATGVLDSRTGRLAA